VGGGGGSGGTTGPTDCGGVGLLTDDFEDGAPNGADWSSYAYLGADISEQGGAVVFSLPPTGRGYAEYTSWDAYDLRQRRLAFELTDVPTTLAEVVVNVAVGSGQSALADFELEQGQLRCVVWAAGQRNEVCSLTYDGGDYRFLGFREEGGTIHWEVSWDGSTWFSKHSQAVEGIFDPRYTSTAIQVEGNGEGSAAAIRLESVTGTASTDDTYCPMSTLVDDFDATSESPAWLDLQGTNGCTIVQASSEVVLGVNSGAPEDTLCILASASSYDLVDDAVSLEITQAPAAGSNVELFLAAGPRQEGSVAFSIMGGELRTGTWEWQTFTQASALAYSATDHRWVRIRLEGATAHWEASSDGDTWTSLNSAVVPFDMRRSAVLIGTLAHGSVPSTTQLSVDNVNVTP
jgi:hypothetical protein